jgi:hypothetical protein
MGRQGLLEPARWASPGFRIATGDPGAEVSFGQPPADREGKSHAVALTRVCEPALQRPRPLPPASCRTTCRGNQSPERASAAFSTMRVGPAPFPAIERTKFAGGDHLRESDRDSPSRKAGPSPVRPRFRSQRRNRRLASYPTEMVRSLISRSASTLAETRWQPIGWEMPRSS